MTTIAYRNDTLVADCRSVRAGWIAEDFPNKVRRLADGTVAAFTGEVGQGEMGVAWLANGRPDPQPDFDDCTILHMREPGVLHIYDGKGCVEFRGPYCAYGSGYPAAMAAMHMGAEAEQAVEMAIKVDTNSGGEVKTLRLVKPDPFILDRELREIMEEESKSESSVIKAIRAAWVDLGEWVPERKERKPILFNSMYWNAPGSSHTIEFRGRWIYGSEGIEARVVGRRFLFEEAKPYLDDLGPVREVRPEPMREEKGMPTNSSTSSTPKLNKWGETAEEEAEREKAIERVCDQKRREIEGPSLWERFRRWTLER